MLRHDDVIKDGWVCQECGHGQEPWDCDLALAILRKAVYGFDFGKGGGSVFIDTGWIDLTSEEETLLRSLQPSISGEVIRGEPYEIVVSDEVAATLTMGAGLKPKSESP